MENITMINHSTRGNGRVVTRMTDSPDSGIKLDLGKGDTLIFGDFKRRATLVYTGKSNEGNLSFSVGRSRFGMPLPIQNHCLGKRDMLLQVSGRNFLISESDPGRIILHYE